MKRKTKKITAYLSDEQYEMVQYLKDHEINVQDMIRDKIDYVYHVCKSNEGRNRNVL